MKDVLYKIRFLSFDLPSSKDPTGVFISKSGPYVVLGLLVLFLSYYVIPTAKYFPEIWLSSMFSLPRFQILINALLTAVLLWAVSYSIGVMLIEKLRRYYRNYIVRPLEECVKKLSRDE
jgi:hypothetical protein